jgi:hypothetical protein
MSTLTLEGKVTMLLPEQTGEGKNGPWKRKDFTIETPGEYSKQIYITAYDTLKNSIVNNLKIGESVKVDIGIQSREFNDKWYTSINAIKIERA